MVPGLTPAPAVGYSGSGILVAGFGALWRVLRHEKARIQIVLVAFLCVQPMGMRGKAGRKNT